MSTQTDTVLIGPCQGGVVDFLIAIGQIAAFSFFDRVPVTRADVWAAVQAARRRDV